MFKSNKNIYRQILKDIFYRIRVHPWYLRLMRLPFFVRLSVAICLFLFGIIGLITPIPAGLVMILFAAVLVFDLKNIRKYSIRLFFILRLHQVIEWVKHQWKK